MKKIKTILAILPALLFSCAGDDVEKYIPPTPIAPSEPGEEVVYHKRAKEQFDLINQCYRINSGATEGLYNENYPKKDGDNSASFLWPYDGLVSGAAALHALGYDVNYAQYSGSTPMSPVTLRNENIGFGQTDTGQFNKSRYTAFAHGAAMMIRTTDIKKFGMMPEFYFLYYEELDWCVQIRRAGLKIWYEATSTVYHKESMSVGKQSPLQVYYHTRNRLLFAKRSIDKRDERIYAYIYQTLVAFPKRLSIYLVKGKFRLIGALGKGLINGLIAINKDMNYGKELSSH